MPVKKIVAPKTLPSAQDESVPPSSLQFDLDNPRFVDGDFSDEPGIVRDLVDVADVKEIVQSILSAGYVDYEPLIVLRGEDVVLEGNRRLCCPSANFRRGAPKGGQL